MFQLKNVERPIQSCFEAETPEAVIKECPSAWKEGTLGAKKCRFVLYARRFYLQGCDIGGLELNEKCQTARTRDFKLLEGVARLESSVVSEFLKLRVMGWMIKVMSGPYPELVSRLEE